MYSFGVVMWEIMHRAYPYEDIKHPLHVEPAVRNGRRPSPINHPDAHLRYTEVTRTHTRTHTHTHTYALSYTWTRGQEKLASRVLSARSFR